MRETTMYRPIGGDTTRGVRENPRISYVERLMNKTLFGTGSQDEAHGGITTKCRIRSGYETAAWQSNYAVRRKHGTAILRAVPIAMLHLEPAEWRTSESQSKYCRVVNISVYSGSIFNSPFAGRVGRAPENGSESFVSRSRNTDKI